MHEDIRLRLAGQAESLRNPTVGQDDQEFDLLRPRIVVPLGNVAARAVFPRLVGHPAPPITQAHAQVFAGDGVQVVPLRHPARISNADLARFVTVMRPLLQPSGA